MIKLISILGKYFVRMEVGRIRSASCPIAGFGFSGDVLRVMLI